MAEEIRRVVAKTRIYLPRQSHGFRPGDTVPLPASVHEALVAAGHLDADASQSAGEAGDNAPAT